MVINFQSPWLPWDNSTGILIGSIKKQSVAYVSREALFVNGMVQVFGTGSVEIANMDIIVRTPTDWINGSYAHIFGTIAFLV